AKKIRGVAGGPGVERRFGFGRLASKEGGDGPAGWFNAACFVGMKTPTAIGVLQGLQERKIFAARASGLELRHGFQRSGHSQSYITAYITGPIGVVLASFSETSVSSS